MASFNKKTGDKKSTKSKKKKSKTSNEVRAIVNPGFFKGSANWLQLQKQLNMSEKDKSSDKPKVTNDNATNANSTCHTVVAKRNTQSPSSKMSNGNNHGVLARNKSFPNKEKLSSEKNNQSSQRVTKKTADNSQPFSFNFNAKNLTENGTTNIKDLKNETNRIRLTKTVAMDCEMVGTGELGKDSVVARVSIVNSYGECIYDEYVKPKEKVTDYRTQVSGVRPADLEKGKELLEVQKDVVSIIEDRIVVGHALQHDFEVLFISHPRSRIRDTSYYKPFREISGGRTPSLKKLTSKILGCEIQGGEHSSVEDAQAAMLLYLRHKKEWEQQIKYQKKRKRPKSNVESS